MGMNLKKREDKNVVYRKESLVLGQRQSICYGAVHQYKKVNIPVSESILSGDQETDWQLCMKQEISPM